MPAPHEPGDAGAGPPPPSLGASVAAALPTGSALDAVVATQRSVCVVFLGVVSQKKKTLRLAPGALCSISPAPHHSPHSLPSLLRLRSARAALDRGDTPESTAAVKAATEEITRNATLLNAARADLEDVFVRARALRRRLEAAFPERPAGEEGGGERGGVAGGTAHPPPPSDAAEAGT
jgi:hypothetical protein